jgi:hypothetical protein
LNDCLCDETDHAESKNKEQHKSARLACLRLERNFANDEKHEDDEGANTPGREEIRDLLFIEPEYGAAPIA